MTFATRDVPNSVRDVGSNWRGEVVNDDGPVAVEDQIPLNLRVRRTQVVRVDRTRTRPTAQLVGLLVSSLVLLAISKKRGRFVVPAAVSLATGSLAAMAATMVARRRHCAREAVIDERIEQSFPASDPPPV
jgi:hypothetical protein